MQYTEKMYQPGTWGGHMELEALSVILKRRFCIFHESQEIINIGNQTNQDSSPIYLAYDRSQLHYSSLRKISNSKEENPPQGSNSNLGGKRNYEAFKNGYGFQENQDSLEYEKYGKEKKVKVTKKSRDEPKKFEDQKEEKQKEIIFKEMFTKEGEEFIEWCLNAQILKKPSYCKLCRSKKGKINTFRLIRLEEYLDKYVWRCKDKDCRSKLCIRTNNKLLTTFCNVELKILLIYVFMHYCYLVPPSTSNQTLGICLKTLKKMSDFLTERVVMDQQLDEIFRGKFGGKGKTVEIDESCFFAEKLTKEEFSSKFGVWCR